MKKTITSMLLLALLAGLQFNVQAQAGGEKLVLLRVKAAMANLRQEPDPNSAIVSQLPQGSELVSLGLQGNWHEISILDRSGQTVTAYIHVNTVELVSAPKAEISEQEKPARQTEKKAEPEPQARAGKKPARPAPQSSDVLCQGLSARFGLMTAPAASFGDRWLLSLAWDKGFSPYFAAGLELQPYFRGFSDAEFRSSTLAANLFLKAKAGVNLGRLVEKLDFLTPYAGLGLGAALAATSSSFQNQKISQFDVNFAWHLLLGLELNLKSIDLIVEFQALKVSIPELEPNITQYFLMLGFRF